MIGNARTMPYVRLGNSGLKVSKIILGTMQYGNKGWEDWVLEEEEGIRQIKAAYDAGIQTFDTANVYSNGASEEILGKAIKEHNLPRDEIVIMTKLYFPVGATHSYNRTRDSGGKPPNEIGFVNQHGLSRKHIFSSVQRSLKRLQLDYIDLLQCHRFDHETPIEETMQALHDVVKAGYVRYIGMSSCYAWQFHVMQNYAISHNLTPFISMQNYHSLVYREEEREMFPTLKHFGVGAIPWSPLSRGLLTRPLKEIKATKRGEDDKWVGAGSLQEGSGTAEIINRVEEIAKKKGITMAQTALAWTISHDVIAAPIVGVSSQKHLEELIAAVHVKLTKEEIDYLSEPYKPLPIFGH